MKTATAQKVSVPAEKEYSPQQLADFCDQRERLSYRLEESMAALDRVQNEFDLVESAEQKARKFLALSESEVGFGNQRSRAHEVLAHCGVRKADVTLRLANRRNLVASIRAELSRIPALAVQSRRQIVELGQSLAQPLP
jgi:hypothetical protein